MEKYSRQRKSFGFESQLSARVLAQLEERQFAKLEDAGSSPGTPFFLNNKSLKKKLKAQRLYPYVSMAKEVLVQLEERLPITQEVAGSSPVHLTNSNQFEFKSLIEVSEQLYR